MTTFLVVLILIACVVLGFFILVQKPKGGGLSGAFGSLGSQVMGVQKSGDVMEKGTWYTMAIIGILSIVVVFVNPAVTPRQEVAEPVQQSAPQQPAQQPAGTPATTPAQ